MTYSINILNYGKSIFSMIPKWITKVVVKNNELVIYCLPKNLSKVIFFLKHHSNAQYNQLVEITGVDYPSNKNRFELVYFLLSTKYNSRIKVKTSTNEVLPITSIVNIYKSANWYEREVWDMYGIFFNNHPDLRRILTDYGFEGHPLRKDFPLSGYLEVRYDEEQKRIVYDSLEMAQEFRNFDFSMPWEYKIKRS